MPQADHTDGNRCGGIDNALIDLGFDECRGVVGQGHACGRPPVDSEAVALRMTRLQFLGPQILLRAISKRTLRSTKSRSVFQGSSLLVVRWNAICRS
jgi:hypothetical protein